MSKKFYFNSGLNDEDRMLMFSEAWAVGHEKWVDKLDCHVSVCRKKIDMSFNKFFAELHTACTSNISLVQWRYTVEDFSYEQELMGKEEEKLYCVFVRFSKVNVGKDGETWLPDVDLFGWVYLDEKHGKRLFDKWGMKRINETS